MFTPRACSSPTSGFSSDDDQAHAGVQLATGAEEYMRTCSVLQITPCGRWHRALTGALAECAIPHYGIGPRGAVAVGASLNVNEVLLEVTLSDNRLGAEGAGVVASALLCNSTLRVLTLDQNAIGSEGCEALARGITGSSRLLALSLAANGLGDDGVRALLAPLCEGAPLSLRSLNLSENGITPVGARELVRALHDEAAEGSVLLQTLDLRWNQLGAVGTAALAHGLLAPTSAPRASIEELALSWNAIGDEGARHLAAVLPRAPTLRALWLENNGIGAPGALALAAALATLGGAGGERAAGGGVEAVGGGGCARLELLSLCVNPIGRQGLRVLAEGVEAAQPACPLRELRSDGCGVLADEPLLARLDAAVHALSGQTGATGARGQPPPAWLEEQLCVLRLKAAPTRALKATANAAPRAAQPRATRGGGAPPARRTSRPQPSDGAEGWDWRARTDTTRSLGGSGHASSSALARAGLLVGAQRGFKAKAAA
ncbi:hypothetical protein KFE25_010217 [Diacronema lutheri]|uniref:Uncharacterized protein n=1 Tax=Diacronema lutheri TaxID=2081491 RepID=A0A8J5XKU9_DIALT|nr:hypothetical protein KFE25_010217 [Diacronema lutheri]